LAKVAWDGVRSENFTDFLDAETFRFVSRRHCG
jgi:hypothetical protein